MYNFPSNPWGVNNDPINSFSDPCYNSLNFQQPYLSQQDHNTLISEGEINYSAYNQPLPFNNLGFSSPSDHGQNHSLHCHNISSQHYSLPLIIREQPEVSDPTIIGSKAKLSSSPNKNEADHVQQKILGKRNADANSSSSNTKKKSKNSKDRHSKIAVTGTTRPRHRRMRLSIEVARQFFDLQDKLGFERASKTVQWLITKAKPEILKLMESNDSGTSSGGTSPEIKTASSNSDSCEGASGLDEVETADAGDQADGSSSRIEVKERKKYSRSKSKRPVVINPFAKELRERARARARARERTKEKQMGKRPVITKVDLVKHDQCQQYGPKMITNSQQEKGFGAHVEETGNSQSPDPLEALLQAVCDRRRYERVQQETVWNIHGQNQHDLPTTSTAAPLAAAADLLQCDLLMNQLGKYWASLVGNNSSDQLGIPQEAQYSNFPF